MAETKVKKQNGLPMFDNAESYNELYYYVKALNDILGNTGTFKEIQDAEGEINIADASGRVTIASMNNVIKKYATRFNLPAGIKNSRLELLGRYAAELGRAKGATANIPTTEDVSEIRRKYDETVDKRNADAEAELEAARVAINGNGTDQGLKSKRNEARWDLVKSVGGLALGGGLAIFLAGGFGVSAWGVVASAITGAAGFAAAAPMVATLALLIGGPWAIKKIAGIISKGVEKIKAAASKNKEARKAYKQAKKRLKNAEKVVKANEAAMLRDAAFMSYNPWPEAGVTSSSEIIRTLEHATEAGINEEINRDQFIHRERVTGDPEQAAAMAQDQNDFEFTPITRRRPRVTESQDSLTAEQPRSETSEDQSRQYEEEVENELVQRFESGDWVDLTRFKEEYDLNEQDWNNLINNLPQQVALQNTSNEPDWVPYSNALLEIVDSPEKLRTTDLDSYRTAGLEGNLPSSLVADGKYVAAPSKENWEKVKERVTQIAKSPAAVRESLANQLKSAKKKDWVDLDRYKAENGISDESWEIALKNLDSRDESIGLLRKNNKKEPNWVPYSDAILEALKKSRPKGAVDLERFRADDGSLIGLDGYIPEELGTKLPDAIARNTGDYSTKFLVSDEDWEKIKERTTAIANAGAVMVVLEESAPAVEESEEPAAAPVVADKEHLGRDAEVILESATPIAIPEGMSKKTQGAIKNYFDEPYENQTRSLNGTIERVLNDKDVANKVKISGANIAFDEALKEIQKQAENILKTLRVKDAKEIVSGNEQVIKERLLKIMQEKGMISKNATLDSLSEEQSQDAELQNSPDYYYVNVKSGNQSKQITLSAEVVEKLNEKIENYKEQSKSDVEIEKLLMGDANLQDRLKAAIQNASGGSAEVTETAVVSAIVGSHGKGKEESSVIPARIENADLTTSEINTTNNPNDLNNMNVITGAPSAVATATSKVDSPETDRKTNDTDKKDSLKDITNGSLKYVANKVNDGKSRTVHGYINDDRLKDIQQKIASGELEKFKANRIVPQTQKEDENGNSVGGKRFKLKPGAKKLVTVLDTRRIEEIYRDELRGKSKLKKAEKIALLQNCVQTLATENPNIPAEKIASQILTYAQATAGSVYDRYKVPITVNDIIPEALKVAQTENATGAGAGEVDGADGNPSEENEKIAPANRNEVGQQTDVNDNAINNAKVKDDDADRQDEQPTGTNGEPDEKKNEEEEEQEGREFAFIPNMIPDQEFATVTKTLKDALTSYAKAEISDEEYEVKFNEGLEQIKNRLIELNPDLQKVPGQAEEIIKGLVGQERSRVQKEIDKENKQKMDDLKAKEQNSQKANETPTAAKDEETIKKEEELKEKVDKIVQDNGIDVAKLKTLLSQSVQEEVKAFYNQYPNVSKEEWLEIIKENTAPNYTLPKELSPETVLEEQNSESREETGNIAEQDKAAEEAKIQEFLSNIPEKYRDKLREQCRNIEEMEKAWKRVQEVLKEKGTKTEEPEPEPGE